MHEKLTNQGRASPFDWEPADTYAKACEIAASIKRRKAFESQSKPIATFAILSANGEWQRGQVATAEQGSPNCARLPSARIVSLGDGPASPAP
jgi:hypothetical protein